MTCTGPAARFNLGQVVGFVIAVRPHPQPLSRRDGRGGRTIAVWLYCGKSSASLAFISSASLMAETLTEPSTIDFLGVRDRILGLLRDILGKVEQAHAAVLDVHRVDLAERAGREVVDHLLVDAGVVEQHRAEQDVAMLGPLVADDVDEPGLGGALLGIVLFDRLDHAERGAVTHAEDDVGVGGELLLGDPLRTGGVVVGGLADHAVEHLGVRLRRLETLGESDGHVVPGRRLAGDDDPDRSGLRRLAGEHAGEVGDFLGLGLDVGDESRRDGALDSR